ncbi:MAG: molybdenum cofactor guanylyltransferase [Bacillota bacterium]
MNAILLAGGESSRFGSNKAFVEINNQLMVEKIVKKLKVNFDKIYLVVQNKDDYSFLKEIVILEDVVPAIGPLGGLYTGLKYSDQEKNYLTACDMPFLEENYIKYLKSYNKDYDVLVAKYNGYFEPFAGVYKKSSLKAIQKLLIEEKYKIKDFYDIINLKIISEKKIKEIADPKKIYFNINYKSDLEKMNKFCS